MLKRTEERKDVRYGWFGLLSKENIWMQCEHCGHSEWRRDHIDELERTIKFSTADFPPLGKDAIVKTEGGYLVGKRKFGELKDAEEFLYHINVQRELKRERFEDGA
ncbi:MAG: hypothetical protein ACYSWP_21995 [Planctomycetota bacterium]|jgi:hypothetical protein